MADLQELARNSTPSSLDQRLLVMRIVMMALTTAPLVYCVVTFVVPPTINFAEIKFMVGIVGGVLSLTSLVIGVFMGYSAAHVPNGYNDTGMGLEKDTREAGDTSENLQTYLGAVQQKLIMAGAFIETPSIFMLVGFLSQFDPFFTRILIFVPCLFLLNLQFVISKAGKYAEQLRELEAKDKTD